jgi:hypothetical protein
MTASAAAKQRQNDAQRSSAAQRHNGILSNAPDGMAGRENNNAQATPGKTSNSWAARKSKTGNRRHRRRLL